MPVITNIADLKRLHERRTPRMFFDYCESGSWTEQTFRENTTDFDKIRLRQKVARRYVGPHHGVPDDRSGCHDARGSGSGRIDRHAIGRW